MINLRDLYSILSAVVPLYVTMFLAYASVKWWKIFTPEQCLGINRFVAIFAVPLLSFEFISRVNPFKMDLLFIASDTVSKIIVLLVIFLWAKFSHRGNFDWSITVFSLSTLPNTLVMGIPLLKSMYGDTQEGLMIQVVVLQCIIWYTLLLFLYEYRASRDVIMQKPCGGNTKSERSKESSSVGKKTGEDEVVHVVIARPSSELDRHSARILSKVVPESGQVRPEEEEEEGKEMNICNSEVLCVEICSRRMEIEKAEKADENCKPETLKLAESSKMSAEMLRLIVKMVWFKLVRNPNSYASLLGLSWALASCRWNIKKPLMLENSVKILSNAGLGMAMFSLGLFMALQPRIIACGNKLAAYGMLMRFAVGPAVMAIASIGVGIRGTTLKVSIVQAALPQGIVPFVFAREYNLHPEVLSTAVILGMIVSLPITILYYIFLGL